MPVVNENVNNGLPANAEFRVGRSNVDKGQVVERGVGLPWPNNPQASYMYYDCTVGIMLDSGIVVHNRLPQVNNLPDTLSAIPLDDPDIDNITNIGVNLKCRDQYTDIVQRMGHARYWVRIWGQGLRVGYQIPIPGIKTIGGVPAIPYDKNPQWAYNRIFPGGNYSGVIMWHAAWSLWYTTATTPNSQYIPAADPYAHISGKAVPPAQMQAPFSHPDQNSVRTGPPQTTVIPGKIQ